MSQVRRLYVEKKKGFDVEAQQLKADLKENLLIRHLKDVRILNRYDVQGLTDDEYALAVGQVFSEPPVDDVYFESVTLDGAEVFAVEYLPGQYDQRADSAAQCAALLTRREQPLIAVAKVYALNGELNDKQVESIKHYLINTVDSREASLDKPERLEMTLAVPPDVAIIEGFILMDEAALKVLHGEFALAMSMDDLAFCQQYFKNEKRDPTVTELRVIDTYWSDHCRHTTFLTKITDVQFEDDDQIAPIKAAWDEYMDARNLVYGETQKPVTLMDIATIGAKALKKQGYLKALDASDEINACSIKVKAKIDGKPQDYLVMFKNETHNHPTEIEPFGGAATCLGGAIRDPLSGRVYVYQAMRVTGCADPNTPTFDTLPGKLPQRKLTRSAAAGYSSYGNQIGLATGIVSETYHDDFVAKRMEIGAVIGAAPAENVVREKPQSGDVILLLGGRTGRDGCGGATGSSKAHNEGSLTECGAEVQKGNPLTERKLQRLFRNPEFSRKVKRCNDFGAGGVCVAIGELAAGLDIDLDCVPKKYEGLDGTELAISESQERMAVVIAPQDVDEVFRLAADENLEVSKVATVTDTGRLKMTWRSKRIVDISREFLDTNGVQQQAKAFVKAPEKIVASMYDAFEGAWLDMLEDLNVCSQKGLSERFDSTIGAGSVLMPFGGKYQLTPAQAMAALIPVLEGRSETATLMTYGYDPAIATASPFHGAVNALVDSVTKIVASGGDYKDCYLTLQEYFERLNKEPERWGKPLAALLGALHVQLGLGIGAIGGKDSMSGSFNDIHVPPTLVSFAVNALDSDNVISNEFKKAGNKIALVQVERDEYDLPDISSLKANYEKVTRLLRSGRAVSAAAIGKGGIAVAVTKACMGNNLGARISEDTALLMSDYGSMLLEIEGPADDLKVIGEVTADAVIKTPGGEVTLAEALAHWAVPLEKVFPTTAAPAVDVRTDLFTERSVHVPHHIARPRVVIPVFPGTNCEYDTARQFERVGALAQTVIIRNLCASDIEASVSELVAAINNAQIVVIPGGFSGGDEPDGSGKFIATTFRNGYVRDAVMKLLRARDGLMLGICNGFQALIKLGLVPYGEICDLKSDSPTLTFNSIGRHVSCLVRTRVTSVLSPWLIKSEPGDVHVIPVSHGEGRFVASPEQIAQLNANGQIATQYVDMNGNPSLETPYNPNGSMAAIEGITSPDGRVFGKMAHSERMGNHLYKNVPGEHDQKLFEGGVAYFR
jgi:phosphoribosylformylglycinamidine synthase